MSEERFWKCTLRKFYALMAKHREFNSQKQDDGKTNDQAERERVLQYL